MSSFPSSHFHDSVFPRQNGSYLPDAFGCFHACDVQKVEQRNCGAEPPFYFQNIVSNSSHTLIPEGPCTPFLPPNDDSANHLDYPKRVSKATLTTQVDQQAKECYKLAPEVFFGPLCDLQLDILGFPFKDRMSEWQKPYLKDFIPELVDGVRSLGVQPALLHTYLTEELQSQYDKMRHDDSFYGGCLSFEPFPMKTFRKDGHAGLLFYPSGQLLDKLNIHALELECRDSIVPVYKPSTSLHQMDLAGGIRQISTHRLQHSNKIFAGVRTDYQCYLLRSTQFEGDVKSTVVNDVHSQCQITSITVSPHIPSEFMFSTQLGQVHLVHESKEISSSKLDESVVLQKAVPVFSHFMAHPRLVFCHTKQQAYQLDFRITNADHESIPLLDLPSICLPDNQYFCVARQHPSNHSYHYLATQDNILVVDERFPNHVVLQWPHLLSSPPYYLDAVPSISSHWLSSSSTSASADDLLLATSFSSQETHCFQCSSLLGEMPRNAKAPWKIQNTSAWLDMMGSVPSSSVESVKERLSHPLVGMCAAQLDQDKHSSFSVFQISKLGDIFHQVLRVSDSQENLPVDYSSKQTTLNECAERRCREFIQQTMAREDQSTGQRGDDQLESLRSVEIQNTLTTIVSPVASELECVLCNQGNFAAGKSTVMYKRGYYVCEGCGMFRENARGLMDDSPTNILTLRKFEDERGETEKQIAKLRWLPKTPGRCNKALKMLLKELNKTKFHRTKEDLGRRLWNNWHRDQPDVKLLKENVKKSYVKNTPARLATTPSIKATKQKSKKATRPKTADTSEKLRNTAKELTPLVPKVHLDRLKNIQNSVTYSPDSTSLDRRDQARLDGSFLQIGGGVFPKEATPAKSFSLDLGLTPGTPTNAPTENQDATPSRQSQSRVPAWDAISDSPAKNLTPVKDVSQATPSRIRTPRHGAIATPTRVHTPKQGVKATPTLTLTPSNAASMGDSLGTCTPPITPASPASPSSAVTPNQDAAIATRSRPLTPTQGASPATPTRTLSPNKLPMQRLRKPMKRKSFSLGF